MDSKITLDFGPGTPGETLAVQIPGAVLRITASAVLGDGITTTVEVLVADDERGGDQHGNVWDLSYGEPKVILRQRGPLMSNPDDYGQLVRDRLAEVGLIGVFALTGDEQLRLAQVRTSRYDNEGKLLFLGGDRVLIGRSKQTIDQLYYYVYSPRSRRECLVPAADVFIEDRAPRWAYWINPVQDDRVTGGYVPSVVIEHADRYWPLDGDGQRRPWVWGSTLKEAKAVCERENQRRRISPEVAAEIVQTSIRAAFTATGELA